MSLVIRGGILPAPVHSWAEPFVLAREAGFELLHFVGQLVDQPLDGLQPILLFEQRFEPLAVADEHVVDAEPLGLRREAGGAGL